MRTFAAMLADAVLVVYAYIAAVALRHLLGGPVEMLPTMFAAAGPFALVHVLSLALADAYNFTARRGESDVAFSAAVGVGGATLACFLGLTAFLLYYMPEVQVIGRSVYLFAGLANLLLLPGWRIWSLRVQERRGERTSRVLFVGDPAAAAALREELEEYERAGHVVVGCVRGEAAPSGEAPSLGTLTELAAILARERVDEVILLGDSLDRDTNKLARILSDCDEAGTAIHLLPGAYDALLGRLDLYAFGGLPMIGIKSEPLHGGYALIKRATDMVAAAAGLLAATPIIAVAAIALKMDSPGPVFYRQIRCGRGGKPFSIIKLRSMRLDAEAETGPVWAGKNDARVTRVGRFLRDKRLDELPQCWNVLKGDMSLVGPRPERPYFVEKFSAELPLFPLRTRVRPGLTSLSHVWGRYDSTPAHRLLYDFAYLNNLSFMLDLRILVDTIKIVITGRGAQ